MVGCRALGGKRAVSSCPMSSLASPSTSRAALRSLARALQRRRLAQLELRDRIVLAVLALLVAGFAYWQVRVPLDGAVRAGGVAGGAAYLSGALAACLAFAAVLAFERHGTLLRQPPGPDWLALPVEPAHVLAHLRGDSRLVASLALLPAAASLVAAIGLLPAWSLLLAAGAWVLGWLEVTRAAAAVAQRIATRRGGPERVLSPATRLLVPRTVAAARSDLRPARWRRLSPAGAIAALDALVSARRGASRSRLAIAFVLGAASLLAWAISAPPVMRRALSFAAFLPACVALGAWAISRTGDLPASLHRPLPLAPRDAWWARARALALAIVALALLATAVAAAQGQQGLAGIALVWPWPGLAVALLGLHQGLTLPSRAGTAETLYLGWLVVMVSASWMIPLLGWIVLAAALMHSLRRLPRGTHPEAI